MGQLLFVYHLLLAGIFIVQYLCNDSVFYILKQDVVADRKFASVTLIG